MRHVMTGLALVVACMAIGCGGPAKLLAPTCEAVERKISVDGLTEDWRGIQPVLVQGENQLWLGQGMSVDNWKGNADLSYSWRAAWQGDKLYFLFIVADDKLAEPAEPLSFLNDCVLIYIDPLNEGGPRLADADGGTEVRGQEVQVVVSSSPGVFVGQADDPLCMYSTTKPQTEVFQSKWKGQVAMQKTPLGYVIEVGFCVPGLSLKQGQMLGVETGVCDNDGSGRKNLMTWIGAKRDFWQNMSLWGQVRLGGRR